ncbi:MAG: type II secretion system F family protein [Bauldia litoralis]
MRDYLIQNPTMAMLLVGGAVFLISCLIGAVILMGRSRRMVHDRISRMQAGPGKHRKLDLAKKAKEMRLRKSETRSDQIASNILPNPAKMRDQLAQTGTGMSLGTYLLGSILAALLTFIGSHTFLNLSMVPSIAAGVAGGVVLPWAYIKRVVSKRIRRFIKQLPDALELMVRGVKAGLPVTESFQLVASEMDSPIADEFTNVSDAVKLGQNLDVALWDTEKRLPIPEWRFFIVSLAIQRETGGNLAETLSNLADVLRKRQHIKLKVKAFSSEARAGAWILGALPFVMFGIIYTLNRPYVMQLFEDSRGMFLIGAAGGSLLLGIVVMAKMIRFEV